MIKITILKSFLVQQDRGSASIEFVLVIPVLFYMLFSMAEASVLMTRSVMIDRGLHIAIRDVKLGEIQGSTPQEMHDNIKAQLCAAAFLIGDCEENVLLELRPIANAAAFPSGPISCVDRTAEVQPPVNFTPGAELEIMLARACLIADPVFPGSGLGALLPVDASGGYAIISQTAFMNEPD